jgi:hypothetical protein
MEVEQSYRSYAEERLSITTILFADDQLLLAENEDDL